MQARPVQTVTSREGIITTLVPHTSREPHSNPLGVTTTLPLHLYRLSPVLSLEDILLPHASCPEDRRRRWDEEEKFNNTDLARERGQGVSLPDLNLNCYQITAPSL